MKKSIENKIEEIREKVRKEVTEFETKEMLRLDGRINKKGLERRIEEKMFERKNRVSKRKGVTYNKRLQYHQAQVWIPCLKKLFTIGYFETQEDAKEAYDFIYNALFGKKELENKKPKEKNNENQTS